MPAKVAIPEIKTSRLEELDARLGIKEDEKTTVTIRQAKFRQNKERSDLFSEFIREQNINGIGERNIYKLNYYTLIVQEIFLTLIGCNITVDDSKPLFRFKNSANGPYLDMSLADFTEALGLLDDETVSEIHSKVLEVNINWVIGASGNLGE
jgi:hypothetical protein